MEARRPGDDDVRCGSCAGIRHGAQHEAHRRDGPVQAILGLAECPSQPRDAKYEASVFYTIPIIIIEGRRGSKSLDENGQVLSVRSERSSNSACTSACSLTRFMRSYEPVRSRTRACARKHASAASFVCVCVTRLTWGRCGVSSYFFSSFFVFRVQVQETRSLEQHTDLAWLR